MAKTANQALWEASVRHQVHVLRFAEGQAQAAADALSQAEQDLLEQITGAMAKGLDTDRLEALLKSVRERRSQVYAQLGDQMEATLQEFSAGEADWEVGALQGASPVVLNLASVPLEQLHAAVAAPIAGIPLRGWLDNIGAAEASALQQAVTQAVLQGQTIDDLVRRIRGTKANGYSDGILTTSTRNAQALARTSVNHVSNQARELVWDANQDIVECLRWTSTLDGRTSPVCRGRDGHMAPIGEKGLPPSVQPLVPPGARPPAHFNCRSLMVAVLDGVELAGDRPTVMDARTRAEREKAFRAEAKDRGVPIQQVRKEWADKHVGSVPSATTYQDWLKTQPKSFQDEVLGRERAELFRGGLPLERFLDKSGKMLTLKELKAEIAGDALNVLQPAIGVKAKGLLMQGLTPEEVLNAIKSEFPEATTSAASIASYKSELKKAGLLPDGASPSMAQKTYSLNTAGQLNILEKQLPEGVKNALQGQWATVVDELAGHPGAYAHYKPGVGVELSDSKLSGLSKAQAQQVMSHELGHMLHKVHGVELSPADMEFMLQDFQELQPELKKLYSYYGVSQDELWAEVLGQALHDSPVTSQGVDAAGFKAFFADKIDKAKALIAEKFPDAPPAMPTGPVMKGIGEVPGKPTSIGGYAKALLQQGMPDQQVLDAVMAEFPSAKTTMNSIKSYKSELKKVELAKGSGPTIVAKGSASIELPKPVPPVPEKVLGSADPAAELQKPSKGSVPLSGLTKVGGKPGGSNPGAVYKDAKGDEWLVKGNVQKANGSVSAEVSDARARNEVLAARLLRFADAGIAPEMKLVDLEGQYGGGQGVMSRMLDKPIVKFDPSNAAHLKAAQRDFALHAWLGNYDAVGASFDNLVMKAGKAVNIDPGGALLFRAQGLPKTDFGELADTWDTMRSASKNAQAAKVYGAMDASDLAASASQLYKFTDEVIDEMVAAMDPGSAMGVDLAKVLKARRDDILKRAGLSKMPPAPAKVFAQEAAASAPAAPAVSSAVQANYKLMTAQELASALIPQDLKIPLYAGKTKASWIIQKAAVPLFKSGADTQKVYDALVLKFGETWVPKPASLASMKSKLKKQGLLEGPIGAAPQGAAAALPQPKLWGTALGSKSTTVKEGAKNLIQQGQDAGKVVQWIGTQFSSPNPQGAQDLYELAHYEVKTGKVQAKAGASAVAKSYAAQPTLPAPVPLRPATRIGEAGPPPPRFTKEGWQAGLQKYGGLQALSDSNLATINKAQKAAGLAELEPEEYAALKAYTGSAYRTINTKLREGHFAEDLHLQAWSDAAMQGMYKLPEWSGDVRRGMSVDAATVKQLSQFYKPGAIVEEVQFTSTANAATGGNFGGNVHYYIKVKTGRNVKPISSFKNENEVLLVPGTKYKVLKVDPTPKGMNIFMEEV